MAPRDSLFWSFILVPAILAAVLFLYVFLRLRAEKRSERERGDDVK